MFVETVASSIAELLEMTEAQKGKSVRRTGFYDTLHRYKIKRGWARYFDRYTKHPRYDDKDVDSYGTRVIELDLITLTAKRLGHWSRTTTKHQTYAIKEIAENRVFNETKPNYFH